MSEHVAAGQEGELSLDTLVLADDRQRRVRQGQGRSVRGDAVARKLSLIGLLAADQREEDAVLVVADGPDPLHRGDTPARDGVHEVRWPNLIVHRRGRFARGGGTDQEPFEADVALVAAFSLADDLNADGVLAGL